MRKVLVRPRIVWVSLLFLILQVSCAHKGPQPPSKEVSENLGTIGVASGSFQPELSLQKRTSELTAEAAKGAGEVSGGWLGGAALSGEPCMFLFAILTLPFVACYGCIVGAVEAEPAEELDAESEAALRNAFEQVNIQEETLGRILSLAKERTNYTFVSLEEQGPSSPDEEFDYAFVGNNSIDTFVEIAVLDVGLVGSAEMHPLLQFFMKSRTRLIRATDGKEVFAATVIYKGAMRGYFVWAENNVQYFREELNNGLDKLSERIVELLFALAWSGKVVEVEEGDTLTVRLGREKVEVRLYGIATLEKDQAFGKKAKQFTSETVLRKVVKVEVPFRDRHGETAALVRAEDVILNETLIQEGLAWVDSRRCKDSICNHLYFLEMEARREKRGLWSEAHPVPP